MKEKLIKLLDKNECDIYHAIEYHEDIEGMWNRLADEILTIFYPEANDAYDKGVMMGRYLERRSRQKANILAPNKRIT